MKWENVKVKQKAKEVSDSKKSPGRKVSATGPGKKWGHTCNSVKGGRFLYIFGGYGRDDCQTHDIHVFDSVKQMWSKPNVRGTPPTARDSHTCTTVDHNLFVFGGTDGTNPLKDLHVLDTVTNTWSTPKVQGDAPSAREGHSAALIGTNIYIFGGCGKSSDDSEESYYNDLYILDTKTFTWAKAATSGTLPSPRDSHSMSSWNNRLFVLGGEDGSNSFLADAYVLDAGKRIMIPLSHKFFFRASKIEVFICIYTRAMLIKFYVHVFIKGVKHF
jgi:N-acetylneuraminic acid mutarotase